MAILPIRFAFALMLLSWAPVFPQEETELLNQRLARIQELRKSRPKDGLLAFYEAMTQAHLQRFPEARDCLGSLLGRGLGLVPMREFGFEPIWQDAGFQALRKTLLAEDGGPAAEVAFRLEDPFFIPEGIAYEVRTSRHFIGSVAGKGVIQVLPDGSSRSFSRPEDGLQATLGLAVDGKTNRLAAVSTTFAPEEDGASAPVKRKNALFLYDLLSDSLQRRWLVEGAAQLNDCAFAPDGIIYVSDTQGGTLFRVDPAAESIARILEPGSLPGINGLAVSPQGRLYAAMSTGIALVDLNSGGFQRLEQPNHVVSGSCDGLYWVGGDLVGVQNSVNPGRVLRFQLAESGDRIIGQAVLQGHQHPAWHEPTTGVVVGDHLHVLANSHIVEFLADRQFTQAADFRPPVILAIPLSP
jgi:hypothetical protein